MHTRILDLGIIVSVRHFKLTGFFIDTHLYYIFNIFLYYYFKYTCVYLGFFSHALDASRERLKMQGNFFFDFQKCRFQVFKHFSRRYSIIFRWTWCKASFSTIFGQKLWIQGIFWWKWWKQGSVQRFLAESDGWKAAFKDFWLKLM